MAKGLNPKALIKKPDDLVTSREETRAGFIALALEKNYLATPYVTEARNLKALASSVSRPSDLLKMKSIRAALVTASGLSEKSLKFLTEKDRTEAIAKLVGEFLEPAGMAFADELVYRYLLTKGDALGGQARNLAGSLGERKVLRALVSSFNLAGIEYRWKDSETGKWLDKHSDDTHIEKRSRGLSWQYEQRRRVLLLNQQVPVVGKNVDVIILNGTDEDVNRRKDSLVHNVKAYIALGELKGGIDPAGADEHWKTANSALMRIHSAFSTHKLSPFKFFIGAAIENSMAKEIFALLKSGTLSMAANMTNDKQLASSCNWIVEH